MINKQMQERDTDMDMLKFAIQHLSKEIYDVTLCNSGYRMSTEMDETISRIEIMLRAAKLMQELNERNCSLTELACIRCRAMGDELACRRCRAMGECPCEEEASNGD